MGATSSFDTDENLDIKLAPRSFKPRLLSSTHEKYEAERHHTIIHYKNALVPEIKLSILNPHQMDKELASKPR